MTHDPRIPASRTPAGPRFEIIARRADRDVYVVMDNLTGEKRIIRASDYQRLGAERAWAQAPAAHLAPTRGAASDAGPEADDAPKRPE